LRFALRLIPPHHNSQYFKELFVFRLSANRIALARDVINQYSFALHAFLLEFVAAAGIEPAP
jgi:hypothetical protein